MELNDEPGLDLPSARFHPERGRTMGSLHLGGHADALRSDHEVCRPKVAAGEGLEEAV
jgi:hypothetical protein